MQQKRSLVLGINCAHDAAACVLIDGEIAAAIPEERLARVKHYQGFPELAINYCLEAAGVPSIRDVDCIVINEYAYTDFGLTFGNSGYSGLLLRNPSHHLLHAYYAWIASGFRDAAILVVDGSGYSYGEYVRRQSPLLGPAPEFSEMEEAETLYVARSGQLQLLDKRWGLWEAVQPYFRFPSLGHMFSMASQYIFGHWIHAGKTMGLAPYGDPNALPGEIVSYAKNSIAVNTRWIDDLPPRSTQPAHLDATCRNLAAKVQAELETAMLYLVRHLYTLADSRNLCLCGGVALNSVVNGRILRESSFDNVFVPPAANDTGIAIGAAFYGHHQLTKHVTRYRYVNDFHGRDYSMSDVGMMLSQHDSVEFTPLTDIAKAAAEEIAAGKVIAWFEGPSEFGPRALGHRSILCDARDENIKDKLNATVKFRECFRPYAASVLAEYSSEFFDLTNDSPYMLFVASVRDSKRQLVPGICHIDNTCRVQTVPASGAGHYRELIEEFMAITGCPMVLNTSLNIRGEPIVETPLDAVRCFLASNIDTLYMCGFRVNKILAREHMENADLIPVLNDGISLSVTRSAVGGKWNSESVCIETRTGYKKPINQGDRELLQAVDAERTIAQITQSLHQYGSVQAVMQEFDCLQKQGLISFQRSEKHDKMVEDIASNCVFSRVGS
jgi:carbamoyltransferase